LAEGGRGRLPYYAYRAGAAAARSMPGPMASSAARAAGMTFAGAMRGRRAMVARHLRRVHGQQLDGIALQREVQRSFDAYARYWMELFRLPSMTPEEIDARMSYEGLGHLDEAVAAGKGAILVAPHLGNYDFGGVWLAQRGVVITAVAEAVEPPELFAWFRQAREERGVHIEPLGPDAGRPLLRALRAGEVLGLVCDRDIGGGGVAVEFFGERTLLPAGPATLALRTGAPILPSTIYFSGRRGHHGVVRPPIPVERTGSLRTDVVTVTQEIARQLETMIRRAPSQWHLFQPNWPSDPGYARHV
jgi:lauroyl/myristoyl acyltransferase